MSSPRTISIDNLSTIDLINTTEISCQNESNIYIVEQGLVDLLTSWNLIHLLDHFISESVDIDLLKLIESHHLERLLKPFNLRTLILFEHSLKKWRESLGIPLNRELSFQSNLQSQVTPTASERFAPYSIASRSSTPTSTKSHGSHGVTLSTILNYSSKGMMLVDLYEKNQRFQDHHRTLLINTIAQYFDEKGIHLDLTSSYKFETEIVERFPMEKIEFYRTGKRGKIYNKFCNLKTACRALTSSSCINVVADQQPSKTQHEIELVSEEGAEHCITSLKYDKLTSEQFDHTWKACTKYRLNEITQSNSTAEILSKWPQYKQPSGFRLIDMDFNFQYKTANCLFEKWAEIHIILLNFLNDNNIKEKLVKEVIKEIQSTNPSENCRDAALLWCLHGYLVPTQKVVRKDKNGKKTTSKFTIKDSQESFLFIGNSIQAIEDHILFLKDRSENVQPFIAAVGENVLNIKEIFVFFDGVKFIFNSFSRAVDICFKIFYLFNLEYPTACTTFWNFIQQFFYKIKTKVNFPKVHLLIDELKNAKYSKKNNN